MQSSVLLLLLYRGFAPKSVMIKVICKLYSNLTDRVSNIKMKAGNSRIICGLVLITLIGYTTSSDSGENKTECDPETQFPCADGRGCTALDNRCDGDDDCADKSDESEDVCKDNCGGFGNRFRCADGKCVPGAFAACSGSFECTDGSDEDEKRCSNCYGDATRWRCKGSTKCINKLYTCDTDFDCGEDDPSDEEASLCSGEKAACNSEFEFACADGNGCINIDYRCDGDNDCADKSDESEEVCQDNCGGISDRFRCTDGVCLRQAYSKVCNGAPECADGSDEDEKLCNDCNGNPEKWKCKGSTKCIPIEYVCDSDLDCGGDDTSDEEPSVCNDNCGGFDGRLQCGNKKCLRDWKACNGIDDCGDNTDEGDEICADCNGKAGRSKCNVSNKCYGEADKCDGYKDCAIRNETEIVIDDNVDEENCPERDSSPNFFILRFESTR